MTKLLTLSCAAGLFASCNMTKPVDQTVAPPANNPYNVPGANPYGNNPYNVPGQTQGEVGQYTPVNPPYQGGGPRPGSAPTTGPGFTTPTPPAATGGSENIPRTHVVQKGDSLWGISRRYGVSVADLRKANGFQDGDSLIRPGQTLFVP